MTYPQQPYGQQPDPYGQGQQPGPYGQQPGQYGQQPDQFGGHQQVPYGGYDQTAQYGGFPGGQYGGLGGPPQPPKKNTGMIVAVVAIVVLLLGGLGVTGFVTPGFFLGDDKKTGGGSSEKSSTSEEEDSGAEAFIDQLVTATDTKDKAALNELTCADAYGNVHSAIDDINDIDGAELADTQEVSADEVTATLTITVDGEPKEYEATIIKDGTDNWCWQQIGLAGGSGDVATDETVDPPTAAPTTVPPAGDDGPGGSGGGGEGEEFVQGFLDTINGGDAAGAKKLLCPDSTSQGDVDDAVGAKAQLEIDQPKLEAETAYVGADLTGTVDGEPVSAARTSAFLEDNGWCIYTFYAF